MKRFCIFLSVLLVCFSISAQERILATGVNVGYVFESIKHTAALDLIVSDSFFSGSVFFDAKYLEAGLGVETLLGSEKVQLASGSFTSNASEYDRKYVNLLGKVILKYPFDFSSLALYPILGIEYKLNAYFQNKMYSKDADLNDLFFDLGTGIDFPVSGNTFLRTEFIYGINLTAAKQSLKDSSSTSGLSYSASGNRLAVQVGFGYRF